LPASETCTVPDSTQRNLLLRCTGDLCRLQWRDPLSRALAGRAPASLRHSAHLGVSASIHCFSQHDVFFRLNRDFCDPNDSSALQAVSGQQATMAEQKELQRQPFSSTIPVTTPPQDASPAVSVVCSYRACEWEVLRSP